MCLTIPGKVKKINKNGFVIKYRDSETKVFNSLIEDVEVDDWVIIQNKFIVNKLSDEQAKSFFQLINETPAMGRAEKKYEK